MKKAIIETFYYICFIAAILLELYRMYLRSNSHLEDAAAIQWVVIGLLVAAVICRFIPTLFPKWIHSKPIDEEIEKHVHNE
jgi:hypothetical protein